MQYVVFHCDAPFGMERYMYGLGAQALHVDSLDSIRRLACNAIQYNVCKV